MGNLFQYTFFTNALSGILFISIAAGIIGTYIVTRRLVSIAGGITHACFGGLGLGYFLGFSPVVMAGVFAIASSLGVEWLGNRYRVRDDSAIAVIWALGMALGVLFVFLTPGYVPELNAFLFGNILTITGSDLWTFAIYTAVLALFVTWRFRQITICAFDRDFASVLGLPVRWINCIMSIFIAIGIVLTIRLVGIMLLMAMLTLPQMTAENFFRSFRSMMIASAAISVATATTGLMLATVLDIPCAAIIVLLQISVYAASCAVAAVLRRRAQ